jgi:ribosomal protein S18 acetylase RimI-like enzyme
MPGRGRQLPDLPLIQDDVIDPVVRPARRDDVVQLRLLEAEARAALLGQRGGDRWLATHAQRGKDWASVVDVDVDADVAGNVDVAVIDDVVVGYLVLRSSGPVASIEEVYVTPEARHVGFGDALIESAMTRARAAGCSTIEGEALPGDRETKNLYERAGITARLIVVSKAL